MNAPPAALAPGAHLWDGLRCDAFSADGREWSVWWVGVIGGYDPSDIPDELTIECTEVRYLKRIRWHRVYPRAKARPACPVTDDEVREAFAGYARTLPVRCAS